MPSPITRWCGRTCLPPIRPSATRHRTVSSSGFWAAVAVANVTHARTVALAFEAELDDGTHRTAAVGTVALTLAAMPASGAGTPFEPRIAASRPPSAASEPRVAICLATYNPDPDFFAAQVDSIIAQRHQAWCCIVSDDGSAPDRLQAVYAATAKDPRFTVVAHPTRLGHYGNFERVLAAVPPDVDFVALADQDDVWYRRS